MITDVSSQQTIADHIVGYGDVVIMAAGKYSTAVIKW